jgi:hypothetical protein
MTMSYKDIGNVETLGYAITILIFGIVLERQSLTLHACYIWSHALTNIVHFVFQPKINTLSNTMHHHYY